MQNSFINLEEIIGNTKKYIENHINYTKLDVAEKTSKLLGIFIAFLVSFSLILLSSIFIGIAIAFALVPFVSELYWGLLIVGGLYLLTGIIIWKNKNHFLRNRFINKILIILYSNHE